MESFPRLDRVQAGVVLISLVALAVSLYGILEQRGAARRAERLRFATLIDDVVPTEQVDYRFRTIDRTSNKDWFVFPWEQVSPVDKLIHDSEVVPARLA